MNHEQLTNVFTYGSLMYPQVINKLLKKTYDHEKATLKGHERRQVKTGVYPGIIKNQSKQVQGVLYYHINLEDMKTLDYFESVQYDRTHVNVQTQQKTVKAIAYLYKDQSNLQSFQWRKDEFEKNSKHTFADNHLEVKDQLYKK